MSSRPKRDVYVDAAAASSPPSELPETQIIARVIKGEGNSLFRVTIPSGEELLVELPSKMRNLFWIKRRGYVVVDTAVLNERENKIGGEIVTVIMDEKRWRKMKWWPAEFGERKGVYENSDSESEEESTMGKMPPADDREEEEEEDDD